MLVPGQRVRFTPPPKEGLPKPATFIRMGQGGKRALIELDYTSGSKASERKGKQRWVFPERLETL